MVQTSSGRSISLTESVHQPGTLASVKGPGLHSRLMYRKDDSCEYTSKGNAIPWFIQSLPNLHIEG